MIELEQDVEKRLKYLDFIDYYANINEEDLKQYREKYLHTSLYKEEIELWTDRILDAKSVEDIFTDQGLRYSE